MDRNLYILAELDNDTQELMKIFDKIIQENGFVGKQTKKNPYHITLGCYSLDHENYLKDLLDNIAKNFAEINVSYNGFGLFGLNVLFLNPCISPKIIELFDYVKENNIYSDNDISPHTTLLMDEPENILKILPKLVEKSSKISGKIKYISLYEFFPKKFIKRIELKE